MPILKTSAQRSVLFGFYLAGLLYIGMPAIAEEMVQLADSSPTLSGRLHRGAKWPAGEVALILHGTLSHRDTEIVQSLEALMSEAGASTLAINLSLGVENRIAAFPCDGVHRHREQDASTELKRWVDWLAGEGVQDITAVGHSRGANQIARYLYDSADPRIEALVLIAPPQWSLEGAAAAYASRYGEPLATRIAQAEEQVAEGNGDELMPQALGLLYCEDARATAASFLSYYRSDPLRDTPRLLAQLAKPTLVIAGSEDRIAAGLEDAMAKRAPGIEVVEIEGADHFFRDLYADDLVDIAIDFMQNYE